MTVLHHHSFYIAEILLGRVWILVKPLRKEIFR